MGTNIYLVKKIKREDVQQLRKTFNTTLQDLQTTRDTWKVLEPLEEALNKLKEEIHICKRSCGWQLLFQSHKELYDTTWESMTNYIKKVLDDGTYIMIDEYGEPYSLQDLKEDLEGFSKGWTGKTYDQYLRDKGERVYCNCEDHEYISDNLRWTDDWFA